MAQSRCLLNICSFWNKLVTCPRLHFVQYDLGMTSFCPSRSLETDLHLVKLLDSLALWILDESRQWKAQHKIGVWDETEIEVFILPILPTRTQFDWSTPLPQDLSSCQASFSYSYCSLSASRNYYCFSHYLLGLRILTASSSFWPWGALPSLSCFPSPW